MLRRSFGPHRRATARRARHATLSLALGLAAATATAGLVPTSAGATPQSQLASATEQAKALEAQITANNQRADVLDEQYNQAQNAVADANRQIAAAERGIARTEAHAQALRRQLGSRAATLYMGAGNTDPIGINVPNVQDLGSRAKYGEAAAAQGARILDDLKISDEQLHFQQKDLEQQRAAAQKKQHDADQARKALEQLNAKMQQLLSSTNAQIRNLAAKIEADRLAAEARAEQARLRRIAQEQAAAQAAAARAARAARASSGGGGSSTDTTVINVPAPSPGAAAAVRFAYQQLGKPYQYAGVGPDSFDCSGLTMMAWAQGGVSMTHGSQAQYDSFPHVPISRLKPGDLVFFGSSGPSNHHVGLVVGPGMMIDAPHTGAFVILVTYYRPDLVPLGARP